MDNLVLEVASLTEMVQGTEYDEDYYSTRCIFMSVLRDIYVSELQVTDEWRD